MPQRYFPIALLIAGVACSNDPGKVGAANPGGTILPGGLRLDASAGSPGGGGGTDALGGITNDGRGPGSTIAGQIIMLIRDFKFHDANDSTTVPDFENVPQTDATGAPSTTYSGPWDDRNIVTTTLGADFKPEYANPGASTLTTHGQEAFDKWYRTIEGTNIAQQIPLTLRRDARGNYVYDSLTAGPPLSPGGGFFPIDDGTTYATKFGNQGRNHNFSFTVEIHTVFTYRGGEVFKFSGDDDVWVYINNQRVIDLGGIHSREEAEVSIDSLGLTKGEVYPLDFFMAERHVTQSNMLITTTLELSTNPDIPIF